METTTSAANQDLFIRECRLIGVDLITTDEAKLLREGENVSAFTREIPGILFPRSTGEVQRIVDLANRFQTKLHPISTGRNWGFGSKLPIKSGVFVVELSKMTTIREYDPQMGYVVIEPGVTQRQLAEFLKERDSDFFLDVTGSSADSSVIGNGLDRGIAYNSLRCENISDLEIVTGEGKKLQTGYSHWEKATARHLFRYPPGASLDGLFFQSSFGIVTAATYKLMPKPENECSFSINFDAEHIPEIIDQFRVLKRRFQWNSIIHIGNQGRLQITLNQLCRALARARPELRVQPNEMSDIISGQMRKEWTAVSIVRGSRGYTKDFLRELKKCMKGKGTLRVFKYNQLVFAKKALRLLGLRRHAIFAEVIQILSNLSRGIPSNSTIQSFYSAEHDYGPDHPHGAEMVDAGSVGFIYCVPLARLTGKQGQRLVEIAHTVMEARGFKPEITLNTITENILEAVVSLSFDKNNPAEVKQAHVCQRELHQNYMQEGFYPYRMNIENMDMLRWDPAYAEALSRLKVSFDPNQVLAPGRYGPS